MPDDRVLSKFLAALIRSVVDKQEGKLKAAFSLNGLQSAPSLIVSFFFYFSLASVMIIIVMIGVYPLFAATRVDVKIPH